MWERVTDEIAKEVTRQWSNAFSFQPVQQDGQDEKQEDNTKGEPDADLSKRT